MKRSGSLRVESASKKHSQSQKLSNHQSTTLENLYLRFPEVGKRVLNELDNKSVVKIRHVNRQINDFIGNEKLVCIRTIRKYIGNNNESPQTWRKVLHHAPKDKVRQLSEAIHRFYTHEVSEFYPNQGNL